MRRASDKVHRARSVRVGGGYEPLPDYLAKFTAPLPPELRLAAQPPAAPPDVEGALAPTHRSTVRATAAALARGGRGTAGAASPRPRAAVFAPGRAAGILVHQKPAPPGGAGPPKYPTNETPSVEYRDPGSFSLQVDYPAVGRRELFEISAT